MSATQTYPFTASDNYTYDTNKVEIITGKAQLKLLDLVAQQFNQPFDSDTNFVYDSDLAEFTGGKVQQKDQRPADATFGANYNADINGNWGDGILTGTATGGATVDGGKLDLSYSDNRYVTYDADLNADSEQVGCIRAKYTPNYSNAPASNQYIFYITSGTSTINAVVFYHTTSRGLYIYISDKDNNPVVATSLKAWNPVADTEYEVELNWDITTGATRLFIDGVQQGATQIGTGIRDSSITVLRVGADNGGAGNPNFKLNDLVIFPTVQHTSDYTPGYTASDNIYLTNNVTLPLMDYPGAGTLLSIDSMATTESGTPKYTIQTGQTGDFYYWTGSAWAVSDGTYAQANDITTFAANISSHDALGCLCMQIKVHFANSNTQSYVSDLTTTYTGQIYSTDNEKITPIEDIRIDSLGNLAETVAKTGSDDIKYAISVDGVEKYWNGSSWATSSGYAQTNSVSEINTNAPALIALGSNIIPIIYLHSEDGSTTPEINNLIVTGDYSADAPTAPVTIPVYGYIYDSEGTALSGVSVAAMPFGKYGYNREIDVSQKLINTTTNADGYWELQLIETTNMPDGAKYIITISGSNYLKRYVVSVPSGAISYNILELEE